MSVLHSTRSPDSGRAGMSYDVRLPDVRTLAVQLTVALALTLAACDALAPSPFEEEIVVEAYLVAGETLTDVRLTRTVPIDERFDADLLGVSDADVRIELLTEDGRVEETYSYTPDPDRAGRYVLESLQLDRDRLNTVPEARPLRSYRLVVTAAATPSPITAITTVPDTFTVRSVSRDTVVYRSESAPTFALTTSAYPGRQNVFVLTTTALEPSISALTPFAKAVYDNGDVSIADLGENVSPPLNEENFERFMDGTLRVQYPWLGVSFYGRNRVTLRTLDDNLHDFIRSHNVQQGGSTLPPGEIPNVIEHVTGGRGIFGSVAQASVEFVVLRSSSDG